MDPLVNEIFSPRLAFETATAKTIPPHGPKAIVLPTTHATVGAIATLGQEWITVGCRSETTNLACALRRAAASEGALSVLVFTDQLYRFGDTHILALLDDRRVHLSALEYILNDKYGYALGVWTGADMAWLPPKSCVRDVATLITTHLRDCSLLGTHWLERDNQVCRTARHRTAVAKRQLRLLHSSTANAYMDDPANPEAQGFLDRIARLGAILDKEHST